MDHCTAPQMKEVLAQARVARPVALPVADVRQRVLDGGCVRFQYAVKRREQRLRMSARKRWDRAKRTTAGAGAAANRPPSPH
jgi:hypothetical protein